MTPEFAEHSLGLVQKHGLGYDVLSDPGNAYAAELGIRFEVPAAVREIYGGLGIDLPKFNGDDSWTLPIPARLVVDAGGIVRAADIDVDYTRRPEPDKTVADVAALG